MISWTHLQHFCRLMILFVLKNQFCLLGISLHRKPLKQLYCTYLDISFISFIKTDWSQQQSLGSFTIYTLLSSDSSDMKVSAELLPKGLKAKPRWTTFTHISTFLLSRSYGKRCKYNMTYTYSVNRPKSIWRVGMGFGHASKSRKYM